jgi:hypothetical protein
VASDVTLSAAGLAHTALSVQRNRVAAGGAAALEQHTSARDVISTNGMGQTPQKHRSIMRRYVAHPTLGLCSWRNACYGLSPPHASGRIEHAIACMRQDLRTEFGSYARNGGTAVAISRAIEGSLPVPSSACILQRLSRSNKTKTQSLSHLTLWSVDQYQVLWVYRCL